MLQKPGLYIAGVESKGRGVFTSLEILPGEVIEICPVILIPDDEIEVLDQTTLYEYYFLWPEEDFGACLAMGLGSIYNHSSAPNAMVTYNLGEASMTIKCWREVRVGDEITIDYQGGVQSAPRLWFENEE